MALCAIRCPVVALAIKINSQINKSLKMMLGDDACTINPAQINPRPILSALVKACSRV
jgi:hypothetical protein